jgi:hypothetical protein
MAEGMPPFSEGTFPPGESQLVNIQLKGGGGAKNISTTSNRFPKGAGADLFTLLLLFLPAKRPLA